MRLLFIYSLLCLLLSACGQDTESSPEQQVRSVLSSIEEAAEARSLSGVMQHISESYRDHQEQSKDDLRRMVQFQFIRNQKINIFSRVQSLEIDGNRAIVELSAAMTGREIDLTNEQNRLRADLHSFSLVLNRDDDAWLIGSASWSRGWD